MRKTALIMGGNGTLGRAMVNTFKAKNWKILSVDLSTNSEADENVILDKNESIQSQLSQIYKSTENFSKEYNSMICVAGGFDVSSIKDEDVIEKYL